MSRSETAEAGTVLGIHDELSPQLKEREIVQNPPHTLFKTLQTTVVKPSNEMILLLNPTKLMPFH